MRFLNLEGGRAEHKSTETQSLPFEKKRICFTKQLCLAYLWATFLIWNYIFEKYLPWWSLFISVTRGFEALRQEQHFLFVCFFWFCQDIPEHNCTKCFPRGAPACCWYESKWFSFRSNPPQFKKGGIHAPRVESAGLWHNRPWIAFWSPSCLRFWQKISLQAGWEGDWSLLFWGILFCGKIKKLLRQCQCQRLAWPCIISKAWILYSFSVTCGVCFFFLLFIRNRVS